MEFYEINQNTPLGFSGAALFNLAKNINSVKIDYSHKSEQSVGSLNFNRATSVARYVRSKAVYPAESHDIAINCADRVELDVNMTFVSQDGFFMDSWDTTLRSEVSAFPSDQPKAGEYANFLSFLEPKTSGVLFIKITPTNGWAEYFPAPSQPTELSAQISHSDCMCDDSTCVTSLVIDATIDSFIPYEISIFLGA